MNKSITLLTLVLIGQIGLALFLFTRSGPSASGGLDQPLLRFTPDEITGIELKGNDQAVRLELNNGRWLLPDHFQALADGERIQRLLGRLAESRAGWPVATTAETARRFKVDTDDYERKLTLQSGGKTVATLYVGTSPGYRKSYARAEDRKEIVTIDLGLYELPLDQDQWVDPDLLNIDSGDVTRVVFPDFALENTDKGFVLKGVSTEDQDRDKVAALADNALSPRIAGVLDRVEKPEFHLDQPLLTYALTRKKGGNRTCRLARLDKEQGYALACSDIPFICRLDQWAGKTLAEASRDGLLKKEEGKSGPGQADTSTAQDQ